MKQRSLFSLVALGAALATAGYALGQAKAGTAAPATPPAKPMKSVRVATIKGVKENQEFQSNVQLVQAQRQAVIELNNAMEKETDAKKKKDLKTQLDATLAKLNENNATMLKVYGFSLARNYTLEIEVAHVNMLVTEEEAAKIEQAQKAKK